MKISVTLADGTECPIIVKSGTQERLNKTCFRATKDHLAGNFIDWRTVNGIFKDRGGFLNSLLMSFRKAGRKRISVPVVLLWNWREI